MRPPQPTPDAAAFKGSPAKNKSSTGEEALAKLDPVLQQAALTGVLLPTEYNQGIQAAQQEAIVVNLVGEITPEVFEQLKPYFVDRKLAGLLEGRAAAAGQFLSGLIMPYNLIKVASFPEVKGIYNTTPVRMENDSIPADDTAAQPTLKDWATLRANARALRENSLPWDQAKAFGDGLLEPASPTNTDDWFEMSPMGPVKAEIAWDRGFMGEGVKVAVIDDGIDFAHPDLMGSQTIYNSTANSHLNGWPMVMDPFTFRAYFYDIEFGTTYTTGGFPGVSLMDTSATPAVYPCGTGVQCFNFTPRIEYNTPGMQHVYLIDPAMTKSGVIHAGTHHDESCATMFGASKWPSWSPTPTARACMIQST